MQNHNHFNSEIVSHSKQLSTLYAADKMSFKIWKYVKNNNKSADFSSKCQLANLLTNLIYSN